MIRHSFLPTAAAIAITLAFAGCGKKEEGPSPAAPKAAATPSKIHEVMMHGDAKGYYYEPKVLVIKVGEAVRWKLSEGGPHNVNFKGQRIPAPAKAILEKEGRLTGVNLEAPGQTYDLLFSKEMGVGEYNYICDPHAALGMTGKIIVQP